MSHLKQCAPYTATYCRNLRNVCTCVLYVFLLMKHIALVNINKYCFIYKVCLCDVMCACACVRACWMFNNLCRLLWPLSFIQQFTITSFYKVILFAHSGDRRSGQSPENKQHSIHSCSQSVSTQCFVYKFNGWVVKQFCGMLEEAGQSAVKCVTWQSQEYKIDQNIKCQMCSYVM